MNVLEMRNVWFSMDIHGNLFQTTGPALENARSPSLVQTHGT